MRLAYLDAFAGVSGDMLLGALIGAGAPVDLLKEALAALKIGAALEVSEVSRSGIHSIKATIMTESGVAEDVHAHHSHAEPHHPAHGGHHHSHSHSHHIHEGRSLTAIRQLIHHAKLSNAVKARAVRAFELLGQAEAKIHHVPLETIHFHEVGAVDAIADIILTAVAVEALQIERWHCSPLNVGGGTVQCAHGRFPVPAPATAELLRGTPTYSSGIEMELVTPTGAALVRMLGCQFGPAPRMTVSQLGYGAGTRDPRGFANVLRLSIGESANETHAAETVMVLETALDDLNPQVIGYVTERALALGAFDVMCTSVLMKKNRPGTLLTVLCDHGHLQTLEQLLLTETSTLGVRIREENRVCLERRHVPVKTPWGTVRIKIGHRAGEELTTSPEFEDCRQIAEAKHVPIKRVQETARQAYRQLDSENRIQP